MPHYVHRPSPAEIPATADVVIIGGGPAGAAALWALHQADPTLSLVLIERAPQLASGSSTASLENFRTCWPTACIAQQMRESVAVLLHADEYLGEGAAKALNIRQRGYLWCGFTDTQARSLADDVDLLHQMDMPHIEYLDATAVQARFPWLGARVSAAKYDPTAGWLDSYALITHYVRSAHNARVLLDVPATRLCIDHGQITGVALDAGVIATRRVVLANGAAALETGALSGIRLPVLLRPRQSFTTDFRHADFPADAPMLIGSAPFPHVRPEAGSSAIFGWEYAWRARPQSVTDLPDRTDALRQPVADLRRLKDPRLPSIALTLLARQFGHSAGDGFADSRYLRGVHHNIGYYVYRDETAAYTVAADGSHTPYDSERAILDQHPQVEGLFLSLAHSGHGIMSSPASGRIIAQRVLGKPPAHPLYEQFTIATHWVENDENAL